MSLKEPILVNDHLMTQILRAERVVRHPSSPVLETDLRLDEQLSEQYNAEIWLASEIHQPIRAYKIRGAYNFMQSLTKKEKDKGVVTASAGNHGQGIALSGNSLGVETHVYMPETTPDIKINRVRELGGEVTKIVRIGRTFDECQSEAQKYAKKTKAIFAPPFDNIKVMAGQGTLGLEIARKVPDIDVVFCPVGGMGLFAGMGTAIQSMNPEVELIGVEPEGARSLEHARANRRAVALDEQIDTFVDGASVAKVGHLPFLMAHHLINAIVPASNMEIRTATTEL